MGELPCKGRGCDLVAYAAQAFGVFWLCVCPVDLGRNLSWIQEAYPKQRKLRLSFWHWLWLSSTADHNLVPVQLHDKEHRKMDGLEKQRAGHASACAARRNSDS